MTTTTLKGKVNTSFPANVTGVAPLIVTNTGSGYVLSFDSGFIEDVTPATDFLALTDTPATYAGQANKIVSVNAGETALEFGTATADFLGLADTPNSYTGEGAKLVRVNVAENALEFASPTDTGLPWVFATDFGVVADNSTDDTAALNACFASLVEQSGTVVLPAGFCKTTDTILVGRLNNAAAQSHINILGTGSASNCGINYNGPTDRPALTVAKMTNFSFSNFNVNNQVAKGTTTGILFGGRGNAADGDSNQTNTYQLYGMNVIGFATGIALSGNFGASSEGSFYSIGLANNDVAVGGADLFNCINYNFHSLNMSGNVVGIDPGVSGGYNVRGGSASNNGTDFIIRGNASCYISGFYSETADLMVEGLGAARQLMMVSSAGNNPTGTVSISGNFERLILHDCTFAGSISATEVTDRYEVVGCKLTVWDTTRKLPVILDTSNNQRLFARAYFRDNVDSAFPVAQILDYQGLMGARYAGGVTVNPFYESCITVIPIDRSSTTDLGTDYLALNHVRSLSEGSLTGATASTAPTPGKNLRVRGTFATSATLAFTFVRTNVVVTCSNATPHITATTGTFTQADVGKKLKITAGADTGADWYGYITDVLSSTTANVFPAADPSSPGQRMPSGVGKATVIGENEPDTQYMVVGLVGSADENFWIDHTTIATTGFTFKSSNATSAATVTALIVR